MVIAFLSRNEAGILKRGNCCYWWLLKSCYNV